MGEVISPPTWGAGGAPQITNVTPMIAAYLANLEDETRSPNTIRTRRHFLRRFAADLDVQTTTTDQIRAWLHSHEWSDGTRYTALVSIHAWYAWANATGHIDVNPAKRIRLIEPQHVHRPVVDDVSLRRGLHQADRDERIAIRLAAECGLRVHELVKVHTRDIHGNVVSVLGKGLHLRRVIASEELLADIHSDGYLLRGRVDGHRSTGWAYDHIRLLTGYPPHALRRRAAETVYRASGHDVRLTQRFLGHANVTTTMVYLGVDLEDLERASQMTRLAA